MVPDDKKLPWEGPEPPDRPSAMGTFAEYSPPEAEKATSEPSAGMESDKKQLVKQFTAADRARMARLFDPEAPSGLIPVKIWLTEPEFMTLSVYGDPSSVIHHLIRRKLAADPEIPWKLGGQNR